MGNNRNTGVIMKKIAFWVISTLVTAPAMLGFMSNDLGPALFAICWSYMWYVIFTKTARGRKIFRKGYKIAASIMQDV